MRLLCQNGSHQLTARFSEYCTYYVSKNICNEKPGYCKLLLLEVTMHSIRCQVTTWYICEWLLCKAFYNMLLLVNVTRKSVVIGCHVFLLKVLCQKRKPQIDGLFLPILHILGQVKFCLRRTRLLQATANIGYHAFKEKPGY